MTDETTIESPPELTEPPSHQLSTHEPSAHQSPAVRDGEPHIGSFAAEHLSPTYPQRAPWGTAQRLRAWQAEALDLYFGLDGPDGPGGGPRDFLAAATPGAGKTTFALRLASELLRRRIVDRIVVVAPTEHLKTQWADADTRGGVGPPGLQVLGRGDHDDAVHDAPAQQLTGQAKRERRLAGAS